MMERENPNEDTTSITDENQIEVPSSEDLQIDPQSESGDPGFMGLIGRAKEGLKNTFSNDSPVPKRGRPAGSKATKDDFTTLVVSLVTLFVTFIKVPDDRLKPNKDEITGLSNEIAGIILRHSTISGKLSADAMAIINITMIGAAWYQRVSPVLAELRDGKQTDRPQVPYRSNGNQPQAPGASIVVESLPQADADFLDSIASRGGEE